MEAVVRLCRESKRQQHSRLQSFVTAICEEGLVFTVVEVTEDKEAELGRKILNLELNMLRGDYSYPEGKNTKS